MWREPQASGSGPVRVYMRDLRTGEEIYFNDPSRIADHLKACAPVSEGQADVEERKNSGLRAG